MNTTINIPQPTPSGISSWEIIALVGTLILSIVPLKRYAKNTFISQFTSKLYI
jgi:hypothetical protein